MKKQVYLELKFSTWYLDYLLYDYHSKNLDQFTLKIDSSYKYTVLRKGTQFITQGSYVFVHNRQKITSYEQKNYQYLTDIDIDIDSKNNTVNVKLMQQILKQIAYQKPGLILKPQQKYKLEAGQTIKMGRIQYRIIMMKIRGQQMHAKEKFFQFSDKIIEKNQKNINSCKICLETQDTIKNPLLNPCQCTGSCGTVHVECLRKWLSIKKLIRYKNTFTIIEFSQIKCQICKSPYNSKYKSGDKIDFLIKIQKPINNYAILETQNRLGIRKVIILHQLPLKGLKLGRSNKNDIFENQKSVSRQQVIFYEKNDGFYISDNYSRHGTILINQEDQVRFTNQMENIAYQIGRTKIQLKVKEKFIKQI